MEFYRRKNEEGVEAFVILFVSRFDAEHVVVEDGDNVSVCISLENLPVGRSLVGGYCVRRPGWPAKWMSAEEFCDVYEPVPAGAEPVGKESRDCRECGRVLDEDAPEENVFCSIECMERSLPDNAEIVTSTSRPSVKFTLTDEKIKELATAKEIPLPTGMRSQMEIRAAYDGVKAWARNASTAEERVLVSVNMVCAALGWVLQVGGNNIDELLRMTRQSQSYHDDIGRN